MHAQIAKRCAHLIETSAEQEGTGSRKEEQEQEREQLLGDPWSR